VAVSPPAALTRGLADRMVRLCARCVHSWTLGGLPACPP